MSIEAVLKKEHKKLIHDLKETQRLLEVIERTMREYNIGASLDSATISMQITEYLKSNNGCATYDKIYANLDKNGIHISRSRLSAILSHNHMISFNHANEEWEIIDNPFRMVA